MALAPGARIGSYEIRGSLGAGGMGEVYRAHDPRLGRDVALKILPSEVAADPARLDRFTRETRAVAALNHPNIVTIHSTEEAEGMRFFTMELVEGQTLDTLIAPGGLPVGRFLDLAIPLADALTAAHQKGITHRDLKPGNVIVASDGRVKVLDFGLARIDGPDTGNQNIDATRADLTHEGTIVGTMPYMSPEQIEGKPLDQRSDLFSLGVMFYEMLAGARPFSGESSPQLMSSILRDVPRDLTDVRPEIPPALSRLVSRCVEKRVDDRVQTARDVFNELRHVQKQIESGASQRGEPSSSSAHPAAGARARGLRIAVLPFTARAGDDEASVLAEGLTDDVTAGLSRFGYLSVVSRAAPDRSVRAGARYLLEGNIRRAGNTIRVGVKLTDTESGAHLWAENYDRDLASGTFALQDDVANRVIATVGDSNGVLVRSMASTLIGRPSAELSVSELVLQYLVYWEQVRPDEHARLRESLELALRREPNDADGWAALSNLIQHEYAHALNPRPDSLARARQAAERANEIDPVSQMGWQALASSHFFARDRAGVHAAAERAIAINPLNTAALGSCGMRLAFAGYWDRGLEVVKLAMVPNPHYPGWLHFVPYLYHYGRREYADALLQAKQVNMPLFHKTHLSIAAAAGQLGARADAHAALDALNKISPRTLDDDGRREWAAWIWEESELEHVLEGVRKAKALVAAAVHPVARDSSPANTAVAPSSSIAVLPFEDMSANRDQEWFCDGIAEEILNALAQLPGLRVAARTSAFSFRGKGDDLHAIGEKLKVATVLEGSVRRSGARLRITVQLVDVSNGFQLWSDRYDRELKDVFDVQDEIAKRIAERLRVTLAAEPEVRLVEQPTKSIEAYELYLKGRGLLYRRGSSVKPALDHFRQAVEVDPHYALAWAGIADAYTVSAYSGMVTGAEARRYGLTAARRALDLNPASAEAHTAFAAAALLLENDRATAEREFVLALELNPNYIQARCWYGLFYLQWARGRFDDGLAHARKAVEADPLSAYVATILNFALVHAGRVAEGVEAGRQAVERDPSSFIGRWSLAVALIAAEQWDEALSVLEAAGEMSQRHPFVLNSLARTYAARGQLDRARAMHDELLQRSKQTHIPFTQLALSAEAAGDRDAALRFAAQAWEEREPPFALQARHFVGFASLRRDPRFQAIIREMDEE